MKVNIVLMYVRYDHFYKHFFAFYQNALLK